MPIISKKKGHLALAVKLLNSGAVDVNPKYAGDSGEPGDVEPSGAMAKRLRKKAKEPQLAKESRRKQ